MTTNTTNGRIISSCNCPITPEMAAAADECFLAYKALNEKIAKFESTIPKNFTVKNFYGQGDCVVIDTVEDISAEQKYWEEHS